MVSDANDVGSNRDIGEVNALIKRIISDGTTLNRNAGQTGARERKCFDAGDRPVVDRAGNDDNSTQSIIAKDGNGVGVTVVRKITRN